MRHAQAEHSAGSDFQRALSSAGRTQATRAGSAIATVLAPELVLASAAQRTMETAERVAAQLSTTPAVTAIDELYGADAIELIDIVRDQVEGARSVLVVGHSPTVGVAASWLAGPGSQDTALHHVRVGLPTAGAAVLDMRDWAALDSERRGLARLVALLLTPVAD